jgi:mono/diheme cytochrome c family protein
MYGAFGGLGAPYLMYRLFPEMFPEIWGDEHDSKLGLFAAPDAGHKLPLGLGFQPSATSVPTPNGPVSFNVVTNTCAACHVGKVTGSDGKETIMVGGPATLSRNLSAIGVIVNHPKFTADAFRAAVLAKPAGWFYGDSVSAAQEATERAVFTAPGVAEAFVDQLRTAINAATTKLVGALGATTYKNDDLNRLFGTPGSNDEFSYIAQLFTTADMSPSALAALVPPKPAPTDLTSVYRRGDSPANWDSSNHSPAHRGHSPAVLNQMVPATTTAANGIAAGLFVVGLPAPPYPFDVNMNKARAGETLYRTHCKSCHESDGLFAPAEVGTDPNRAMALTQPVVRGIIDLLKQVCTDPAVCNKPDDEIFRVTGKYRAVKLDGLWSRAPYLHNGSVPTLRQLLVPSSRPPTFVRGDSHYDEENVGFQWQNAGPETALYDTSRSGNSNAGHDTPAYLGIDWAAEPEKLDSILEYLKTL